MHFDEKLEDWLAIEHERQFFVYYYFLRVFMEELREKVVSLEFSVVDKLVCLSLKPWVKDGQKEVHEEPQPEYQEEDEEKAHVATLVIWGQHDVRKVGRR